MVLALSVQCGRDDTRRADDAGGAPGDRQPDAAETSGDGAARLRDAATDADSEGVDASLDGPFASDATEADVDPASLAPSFRPLFPALTGDLMTTSSPSLADLTGDGVLDIVFGTGVQRRAPYDTPAVSGYVVAVSGATNEVLWQVPNPTDAFTTPRFSDLDDDGVPDIVMGGREGAFGAFSGVDGSSLWRVAPEDVATTPFPYNFYTPAWISDVNGDARPDIVVTYGGDDTKQPDDPRDPGFVAVISGLDGAVLAAEPTPDGSETYASPVVYRRSDGSEWVVFGTGGETHGGASYRAPVAALFGADASTSIETLVDGGGSKGVIAPATIVDLTGDGEPDVVVSTFDGRLVAVDGVTSARLWEQQGPNEEAYHPPAVLRREPEGALALFVSRGMGAFPDYTGSVHRMLDATDGRVLYEYRDELAPAGAPLAVDLTGDGADEIFFFSMRFPSGEGATIHILHPATGGLETHVVTANFGTTPVVAATGAGGRLELIGLSFSGFNIDALDWRTLRWQLTRMALDASAPTWRSWAGYMGTATNGAYPPEQADSGL